MFKLSFFPLKKNTSLPSLPRQKFLFSGFIKLQLTLLLIISLSFVCVLRVSFLQNSPTFSHFCFFNTTGNNTNNKQAKTSLLFSFSVAVISCPFPARENLLSRPRFSFFRFLRLRNNIFHFTKTMSVHAR